MTETPKPSARAAETTLRSFLARFDDRLQKLARSIRAAIKRRFPTANELAYDYGSHVVIAYAPSDRGIEAVVAIDARTDGVRLYFGQATRLPDPEELLQGTGKQARFVALTSARDLRKPAVTALLDAAERLSPTPLPTRGKGTLVIRSESGSRKKRPSRRK